jgi:hypothetical protein
MLHVGSRDGIRKDGGGCEFRRFLNYLYYSPYLDFPAWAAQASREAVPG